MTSIHASIPSYLEEAASAARRRGEEPGTTFFEDVAQKSSITANSTSSSNVVLRKLPQRLTKIQPIPQCHNPDEEASASEEDDESASKENDPTLSPSPVTPQVPRRPSLVKRPLSDLPTPTEIDPEATQGSCLSPSDQNILNNKSASTLDTTSDMSCKRSHSPSSNANVSSSRGLQDANANGLAAPSSNQPTDNDYDRPAKRTCSEESKENVAEVARPGLPSHKTVPDINNMSKSAVSASRQTSAPGSLGTGNAKGKARIGLRRL